MQKRNRIMVTVLSILLVLVSVYSNYHNMNTVSKDEVKEREEILIATLPVINIPEDEIKGIVVLKSKAGAYPYMYNVAVNKKNGTQVLYGWADKDKSKVIKE